MKGANGGCQRIDKSPRDASRFKLESILLMRRDYLPTTAGPHFSIPALNSGESTFFAMVRHKTRIVLLPIPYSFHL
jgi:hypothetical protein